MKQYYLSEIAKGCQKTNGLEGDLSFFAIDEKEKAIETNRYKSGYIVPHYTTLAFLDQKTISLVNKLTYVLDYTHAALLFSETHRKKGVLPHVHIPASEHPTVTLAKIFHADHDPAFFNFYEKVQPSGTVVPSDTLRLRTKIGCQEDSFFIFDSSTTPHEVEVLSDSTSITGYFFFEEVKNPEEAMKFLGHKYYDLRQ